MGNGGEEEEEEEKSMLLMAMLMLFIQEHSESVLVQVGAIILPAAGWGMRSRILGEGVWLVWALRLDLTCDSNGGYWRWRIEALLHILTMFFDATAAVLCQGQYDMEARGGKEGGAAFAEQGRGQRDYSLTTATTATSVYHYAIFPTKLRRSGRGTGGNSSCTATSTG